MELNRGIQLLFIFCIWFQILFENCNGRTFEEDLTLTLKEKQILEQFKEKVSFKLPHDYMKEDVYLVRWLRARYYDLEEAEIMLMNNLEWRKDTKMDTVQEEDWTDYLRNYKYSLGEARDKDWKPLVYVDVGGWDLRNAAVAGRSDKFMRYIDKVIDQISIFVRTEGNNYKNVSQAILILNMEGFNLVQQGCFQCVPIILRIIVTYETHFPGIADKIILVNTPTLAEPVIRAARIAFHPNTNRDFFVFGTNKKQWKDFLSRHFEWNQLPYDIGGTKYFESLEDDYY